jgi:hypothetical protein
MSIKYKFNEYTVAYNHDFTIETPTYIDSKIVFSLSNFSNIFKINELDGSIYVPSNVDIGIYDLFVVTQKDKIKLKIIIKPNVTFKINSFYNNGQYKNYLPIINPPNISLTDINYFKFEKSINNIYINNKTGEIGFDESIIAGIYTLEIICSIKNVIQTCIISFNIYPIIKYQKQNYFCEKKENFSTDIPYIKPSSGEFKLSNNYSGITIDQNNGQINTNNPNSGGYNLVVVYTFNNISINSNILINIKPIISYEKSIIDYDKLIQLNAPINSDPGGIYKLENNKINKNLSINSFNGKITIKNILSSGSYFIKLLYSYNNFISDVICELDICPNIYYINNKIEILFGSKYQTDMPFCSEDINGSFSLINSYQDIYINPKNGIIYIGNNLECNDYCLEINYNKNDVNKIIPFFIKIKPILLVKTLEKQEINYYENLNDIIIDTNPNSGILTNNLNISIQNNLIKLSEFEKIVGNHELKINYVCNNIVNKIIYNFIILPYIFYNNNNINITYKQSYISEKPSIYPFDGKFYIKNKINNISINENTGEIIIKNMLIVGIYELFINYEYKNLINTTSIKITCKPYININNNKFEYEHNPNTNIKTFNLDPIDVQPKCGSFSSDIFSINNEILTIPSDLEIGDYLINIKYNYLDIETKFEYYLKVIPYKLNCQFKQQDKIYDGKTNVKLKYFTNCNLKLVLNYEANFDSKHSGNNKLITIKNIKVINNNNIISNDTKISGYIKPLKLNIIFECIEKCYDGTLNTNIKYQILNIIEDDKVFIKSFDSYYENINVGKNTIFIKNIILDGEDSINYFTENSYEISGKIKPKEAFISFKSPEMIYNKGAKVFLEIDYYEDLIANDKIWIESYSAFFENSNVGENIPINVTNIKCFKNNNYILKHKPLFGKITKKELKPNITCVNKIYDGTKKATVIFDINDINDINISSYDALYESKDIIYKNKVYVSNIIIDNENYFIKDTIINGNILPLYLQIQYTGENKIYDGNTNINGNYEILNKINEDKIDINFKVSFKNFFAQDNKELTYTIPIITGPNNNNYKINKIILNSPHIFKKKIEYEFIGINKIYDNTNSAIIKIKNDINNKIKIKSYQSYFEDKNVGINKKIIIDNIILSNDNYYCETCYTFANIEKKSLSIVVEPLVKYYDSNIESEIKIINILGICFNDNIYIVNYKTEFNNPYVGTNKILKIFDFEFGGTSKDNYYCKDFTIISSIKKREIVFDISNNEKLFDNDTNIDLKLSPKNICETDNIQIKSFIANFDNCNIGNEKVIFVKNIIISGELDSNYNVSDFKCYGKILPGYLDLEFKVNDKKFDNNKNANVKIIGNYNINYQAEYENENAGNNKQIIIKILDYKISNYILYDTYTTFGNIIPIEVKPLITIKDKIYDNTNKHHIDFDISNNKVIDYNVEFEDINVGINKKIFINNIKLENTNYFSKNITSYCNIIPVLIDVDYKIQDKIFDNTTKAIIIFQSNILSYNANYSDFNVGEHGVMITNIICNNKNYIINDIIIKSKILPKSIIINIIIDEKEYNNTKEATIKNYNSKYDIKIIKYNAEFENELIGENKKVYIFDIELDNKNYICENFYTTSKIITKNLELKFKDTTKIYDSTNIANLEISEIIGIINNENVYINNFDSQFLNKNSGDVFLLVNNIILNGIHASNYNINKIKIQTKINKRKLDYIINVVDKIFDNNDFAFINIVLNNIINNDDVYIKNFIAYYDNESKGFNKKIFIKNIELDGNDVNNYYIENEIIIVGSII